MIAFPVSGPRGRYLLKLDPPELPHLVANEAFFLHAARACGLATASARVVTDRDGRQGLLVERFDRRLHDGALERLAQEDGCQVLGRYPADKYRLSAEEVVHGLSAVTAAPVVGARELRRQLAFAYLTGNGDAHAKNLSIRQTPGGEWRPTPAYDVPSSHPYGDTTMALTIDGTDRDDPTRRRPQAPETEQAPRYRDTGSRAPVLGKDRGDGAIGAIAAAPRRRRVRGRLRLDQRADQGSITSIPHSSKSATLRVATPARRAAQLR